MKKLILFLAIVGLLWSTNSFAQESPSSNVSGAGGYLGFRFMPTFTSFNVKTLENGTAVTKFTLGYGYGAVLGGNFSNNVGAQAEVFYSTLSQRYTDKNMERRIDLNYVNIPLLLVLNTGVSAPVNLNICAGPQFGINAGAKVMGASGVTSPEVDTVTAVLAVKAGDAGIAYGIGIDFLLGKSVSLDFGYRGVMGLVDISANNQSTVTNQFYILDRAHVKTYAAYAGIRFRF